MAVLNQPVPDSNENTPSRQRTTLRSFATVYDKNSCIICQKEGGKLNKVYFKSTREKMLTIAKNLTDISFNALILFPMHLMLLQTMSNATTYVGCLFKVI